MGLICIIIFEQSRTGLVRFVICSVWVNRPSSYPWLTLMKTPAASAYRPSRRRRCRPAKRLICTCSQSSPVHCRLRSEPQRWWATSRRRPTHGSRLRSEPSSLRRCWGNASSSPSAAPQNSSVMKSTATLRRRAVSSAAPSCPTAAAIVANHSAF